ncbi:glycosyltransferase family 1 protein [Halieaceae bacterium IMCC14734]|uniref:Glycosyltransferase family 1 protein n=2 Tax=Candidatus Litorirhabdus singularis TaxID=2518993 RepID=A0ABT3TCK2_9GAMM|nr:glycosyltransferase family 1 protein [Candidatus Litorirhabdus singularis]
MQAEQPLVTALDGTRSEVHPLDEQMPIRPLRIALLGYRSAPFGGGQGVYINYLSKALVEAGHSVDVISGPPYPHLDPRVRLIQLPSLDLFANGLLSLRWHHLRSLTNIIEWLSKLTGGFSEPYTFGRRAVKYFRVHGSEYDIVHDNQSLSWGMLKIQASDLPLVTTIHHPITSDLRIALKAANTWWQRVLIRRWHSFLYMQKRVVQRLHHIVTVSEQSRQDIAQDFGIQPAGISLVYNGIDTEVFRPMSDVQRLPNRLMTIASADQPLKGLRYLLLAYARLLKHYPELELLVVGKPRAGGDTENLLKKLGLIDKVRFVSGISTPDLVRFYAEATVAICPSIYEGFGLPAGEAMACGVPTVSTDGGALPEVVGDAGVLVPVRDSHALADAIAALLDDDTGRERLGLLGRQRILDKFCWHVNARRLTHYYYQVLEHADR